MNEEEGFDPVIVDSDIELDFVNDELVDKLVEEKKNIEEPKPAEDDDDDNTRYGKKIEKRFAKITKRHYDEINELKNRLNSMENENKELKATQHADKRTQEELDLSSRISDLLKSKKEALDVGDHDQVVDLDQKIMDLKIEKSRRPEQVEAPVTRQQPTANQAEPPQALLDWEAQNQWVYNPKLAAKKAKANELLKTLVAEGWEVNDPETFEELDKKLARAPINPSTSVDRGASVEGSSVRETGLSSTQRKLLAGMGLDINDPKVIARFKKNTKRDS